MGANLSELRYLWSGLAPVPNPYPTIPGRLHRTLPSIRVPTCLTWPGPPDSQHSLRPPWGPPHKLTLVAFVYLGSFDFSDGRQLIAIKAGPSGLSFPQRFRASERASECSAAGVTGWRVGAPGLLEIAGQSRGLPKPSRPQQQTNRPSVAPSRGATSGPALRSGSGF